MAVNDRRLRVLKTRSDFQSLFKNGRRLKASDWLLLNFAKNDLGYERCGWTLPRQVGSAVIRNKLKRWSRQYIRAQLHDSAPLSIDVNLVFRKGPDGFYKKMSYDDFSLVLGKAWEQMRKRL